jgi:hypothetical protein
MTGRVWVWRGHSCPRSARSESCVAGELELYELIHRTRIPPHGTHLRTCSDRTKSGPQALKRIALRCSDGTSGTRALPLRGASKFFLRTLRRGRTGVPRRIAQELRSFVPPDSRGRLSPHMGAVFERSHSWLESRAGVPAPHKLALKNRDQRMVPAQLAGCPVKPKFQSF